MRHDAPPSVLLVEDDPHFATRISAAVSVWQSDAQTMICGTGTEAFNWMAAREQPIDLALIDLALPDMDGNDVIAALRRRSGTTPILVLSVLTSERSVLSAIRSGANGYITKDDFDVSIAAAIRDVVRGNYPLSPALARHLFQLVAKDGPEQEIVLSVRETDALRCIARGLSYEQTAKEMGISISTVQSHVRNLYRKLNVHSQVQAAIKARDLGLG